MNSIKPFITIITVVFNGEKTIRKTIESVLNQKFINYEYIIVDGLSNDNTISVAKEYEKHFEGRLRIYSEKDNGIYNAMNKGIKLSKGDYIWLVNADDWIEPNALSIISQYHEKYSLKYDKLLQGGINIVDNKNNFLLYNRIPSENNHFEKSSSKLKMGICHPSTIVPRQVYDKVGLYDERYYISADVDFAIRCYRAGVKLVNIQSILTNMSDGGISNQLPLSKNLHDWNLRFDKFCTNSFQKVYYLILNVSKLFLRKYLPKKIIKILLKQ